MGARTECMACDRCGAVVPAQPAAAPPYPQQGQPAYGSRVNHIRRGNRRIQRRDNRRIRSRDNRRIRRLNNRIRTGSVRIPAGSVAVSAAGTIAASARTAVPPSAYAQGPPAHAAMAPPRGKSSSKVLWIAIAGAVAVVGIIVVVVLATRGGGETETASKRVVGLGRQAEQRDRHTCRQIGSGRRLPREDVELPRSGVRLQGQGMPRRSPTGDHALVGRPGEEPTDGRRQGRRSGDQGDGAVTEAYTKCVAKLMSATATPSVSSFAVGDRVMARWTNGQWYPGKISAVRSNGTFDIQYDDGDRSSALPASSVRKRTASTSTSTSSSRPAGDAPCPGPGITRRCNGTCVNIQEDNNHCGGCNHQCPSGKHCDGHLVLSRRPGQPVAGDAKMLVVTHRASASARYACERARSTRPAAQAITRCVAGARGLHRLSKRRRCLPTNITIPSNDAAARGISGVRDERDPSSEFDHDRRCFAKNGDRGTVAKLAAPALNAARTAGGFMREHWVGMVIGAASTVAVVAGSRSCAATSAGHQRATPSRHSRPATRRSRRARAGCWSRATRSSASGRSSSRASRSTRSTAASISRPDSRARTEADAQLW